MKNVGKAICGKIKFAPTGACLMFVLLLSVTPRLAHADSLTKMGLDNVAQSISCLAAAVAVAGLAVALAIYLAFKSRRQD